MLKDLKGKSVYDLEVEDFEKLFCHRCRYNNGKDCFKRFRDMSVCKTLIDGGVWYQLYQTKKVA